MTISHTQLAQLNNSKAMRDLEAMARATAAMSRRADALLQSSVPDAATVDRSVREALTRDGALPASAQRPASGAPAPLPRHALAAGLALCEAGVALSMGVARNGLQDAATATIAPTRESATPAATQPRYDGARALDASLPAQAMVEDAVGAMFGLSPKRPGR